MHIFAVIFALIFVFILFIYLEVDTKMTLRYIRGPRMQVTILEEKEKKMFSNYGAFQKSNKYFSYLVQGQLGSELKTGIIYTKEKHHIGEVLTVPYWIDKEGNFELTPRTYRDRLVRMLIAAIIGIPWIGACIWWKVHQ